MQIYIYTYFFVLLNDFAIKSFLHDSDTWQQQQKHQLKRSLCVCVCVDEITHGMWKKEWKSETAADNDNALKKKKNS